jgi:hypothetical protein
MYNLTIEGIMARLKLLSPHSGFQIFLQQRIIREILEQCVKDARGIIKPPHPDELPGPAPLALISVAPELFALRFLRGL